MAADRGNRPGESQARRLEAVYGQLRTLLSHADDVDRLREPAGNEWSVAQVLGHMAELIPYWLGHCRALIASTSGPPAFGRGYLSPERLAGIARGSDEDPEELLGRLHEEVSAAARAIREMSPEERSRKGVHLKLGELTVADAVERCIVAHAEEHLEQIRTALSRPHRR